MKEVTHDSISLRGAGVLFIAQHKKGIRFTLDSLLLADFCRIKPRDRILEPGAGTGIVSLLLAKKFSKTTLFPVEVQPDLVRLCRRNITANGLQESIIVIERDIKMLGRSVMPRTFDVIVANPPYTKIGTGIRSPVKERQTARHDETASVDIWLDLQVFLKNKGRFYVVFAAGRMAELLAALKSRKLEPKRLRVVHPYADKPASLVLIEAVKAAGAGLEVLPPLIVHEYGGAHSEVMKKIYGLSE